MPSTYILANVKVTNPTQYEEYRKWSTAAMQACGAEVCVRGGAFEVIEGDWTPDRLVLLKFPSKKPHGLFTTRPNTPRRARPAKEPPSCAW